MGGDEEPSADDSNTYINAWQNISRLMDSGSSWSGRERNCAFLNLGDREFVDVSAAAGLDSIQDGRAVAQLDWDGDGDLDLWLKSRNGHQLRLFENTKKSDGQFLAVRLEGTSCNRDAIGARVKVVAGDQEYLQELRCGEGYLSQSSNELLFGLPGADAVDRVEVLWPGGELEVFEGVLLGSRQRLVQGAGVGVALGKREFGPGDAGELPQLPKSSRVVLRTPLPMPTSLQRKWFSSTHQGARLINLWATWCAPCVTELGEFAKRSVELSSLGLEIVPLRLDPVTDVEGNADFFERTIVPRIDPNAAFQSVALTEEELTFFEVIFQHLIAKPGALPVPASLLVDKHGLIEVVYLGPVDVDDLIEDVAIYGLSPESIGVRSNYPGRWFYGMPRDLDGLSRALRSRGLRTLSNYYTALHRMSQQRSR
jgi:hypothetical protein